VQSEQRGSPGKAAVLSTTRCSRAALWHQRLGHLSYETMARMVKAGTMAGMDVSIKELKSKQMETYDFCIKAKHAAALHKFSNSRAEQ
jgi:hypothetical protein